MYYRAYSEGNMMLYVVNDYLNHPLFLLSIFRCLTWRWNCTPMRLFCDYGSSPLIHLRRNGNPTPTASLGKKVLSCEHCRQQRKKIEYLTGKCPRHRQSNTRPSPSETMLQYLCCRGHEQIYIWPHKSELSRWGFPSAVW